MSERRRAMGHQCDTFSCHSPRAVAVTSSLSVVVNRSEVSRRCTSLRRRSCPMVSARAVILAA